MSSYDAAQAFPTVCADYRNAFYRQTARRIYKYADIKECKGEKYVNGHYEKYFDGGSMGDHQYHTRWTSDTCPKCKGKGYLEKKVTWE